MLSCLKFSVVSWCCRCGSGDGRKTDQESGCLHVESFERMNGRESLCDEELFSERVQRDQSL